MQKARGAHLPGAHVSLSERLLIGSDDNGRV